MKHLTEIILTEKKMLTEQCPSSIKAIQFKHFNVVLKKKKFKHFGGIICVPRLID